MLQTLDILMKAIEVSTDYARRRARRLIEKVLQCRPAAFNQQEQVLLEQLKNALTAKVPLEYMAQPTPDYSGWAPLGI